MGEWNMERLGIIFLGVVAGLALGLFVVDVLHPEFALGLFVVDVLHPEFTESDCQLERERENKILTTFLIYLSDTNRGMHFLDENGCEWRIVVEPSNYYIDCKQKEAVE